VNRRAELLLFLAACQGSEAPAVSDCPALPYVGVLPCDAWIPPDSEARTGTDLVLANEHAVYILRDPLHSLGAAGAPGGSLIDALTWSGQDLLYEALPVRSGPVIDMEIGESAISFATADAEWSWTLQDEALTYDGPPLQWTFWGDHTAVQDGVSSATNSLLTAPSIRVRDNAAGWGDEPMPPLPVGAEEVLLLADDTLQARLPLDATVPQDADLRAFSPTRGFSAPLGASPPPELPPSATRLVRTTDPIIVRWTDSIGVTRWQELVPPEDIARTDALSITLDAGPCGDEIRTAASGDPVDMPPADYCQSDSVQYLLGQEDPRLRGQSQSTWLEFTDSLGYDVVISTRVADIGETPSDMESAFEVADGSDAVLWPANPNRGRSGHFAPPPRNLTLDEALMAAREHALSPSVAMVGDRWLALQGEPAWTWADSPELVLLEGLSDPGWDVVRRTWLEGVLIQPVMAHVSIPLNAGEQFSLPSGRRALLHGRFAAVDGASLTVHPDVRPELRLEGRPGRYTVTLFSALTGQSVVLSDVAEPGWSLNIDPPPGPWYATASSLDAESWTGLRVPVPEPQ